MKLTIQEIKKIFENYQEVEEHVEKIALEVFRLRNPYTPGNTSHGGGPHARFERFYVDDTTIAVFLDTGCCGSYDNDYLSFPISYLSNEQWQKEELQRIAKEKQEQEKEQKARKEKQQKEQEERERKIYDTLKKKYG